MHIVNLLYQNMNERVNNKWSKLNFEPTQKTLPFLSLTILIFVKLDGSQQFNMCCNMFVILLSVTELLLWNVEAVQHEKSVKSKAVWVLVTNSKNLLGVQLVKSQK